MYNSEYFVRLCNGGKRSFGSKTHPQDRRHPTQKQEMKVPAENLHSCPEPEFIIILFELKPATA
jgi:hypothetical protein